MGKPKETVVWFENDDSWYNEVKDFIDPIEQSKQIQNGSIYDAIETLRLVEKIYNNSGLLMEKSKYNRNHKYSLSKSPELVQKMNSLGFKKVKPNPHLRRLSESELIIFFTIVMELSLLDLITPSILKRLPNLKFISKYGVGMDNINQEARK